MKVRASFCEVKTAYIQMDVPTWLKKSVALRAANVGTNPVLQFCGLMTLWTKYEKAGGPGLPQTGGRTQISMFPGLFCCSVVSLHSVFPCSSLVPPSSLRK